MKKILFSTLLFSQFVFGRGISPDDNIYWMKIPAKNSYERTEISNTGAVIESVTAEYVTVLAKESEKAELDKLGKTEVSFLMTAEMMDFPNNDQQFHNYNELFTAMNDLANKHASILKLDILGKSANGQDIHVMSITGAQNRTIEQDVPAIFFVGTHHAREHLSTEVPLKLAQYLAEEYEKKNERIMNLVDGRVIYIAPLLNPDGSEYDISTGSYKMWRKNRKKNSDGSYGVDLNRNYGFKWGLEGASSSPSSDTYRGTGPFSEPETQAVKNFVESHANITSMLSFHTFSKLVLYPWGFTHNPIEKDLDRQVFETMGRKMASLNGYTPQTGADLYLVSGEMNDWAYGDRGIFGFTFELDPASMWEGGFYPGQKMIEPVFKKNLEPCLYMIDLADNPYRSVQSQAQQLGLNSAMF